MNTVQLETTTAGPIQALGMAFYFDPGTAARAKELGMNVFEFYGLGRGGVLGDVSADEVEEAFWFFHRNAVNGLWASAGPERRPSEIAREYVGAAYDYTDRAFGAVPAGTAAAFAAAARRSIEAAPRGQYALFDGYRSVAVPADPRHAAYLAMICLRELRGGVHIETTKAQGLTGAQACFLTNEMIFKLHGYSDADAPERTTDLEERLNKAEEQTTAVMAGFHDGLSDGERDAYAAGVAAFDAQLPKG